MGWGRRRRGRGDGDGEVVVGGSTATARGAPGRWEGDEAKVLAM